MKLSKIRAVVGLAALSLGLTGCGGDRYPAYSANVKYGVRQDPIVQEGKAKDLGEDRYDPDRPGLLPIMKFADIHKPDHPYFANASKINDNIMRDPGQISEADRKTLEDYLEVMFGTPAKPTIKAKEAGIDEKDIKELKVEDAMLAEGSKRYRVHCLHCHGVPGDGRGPTARWINPHPRDFRKSVFKFTSVNRVGKNAVEMPSRADLLRTLRQGLEGTAMPSFGILLDDEDLESLVSYVIHLSLRGTAEWRAIIRGFDLDPANNKLKLKAPGALQEEVKFFTKKTFNEWVNSNKPGAAIIPEPYPYGPDDLAASVQRGQQMFTGVPTEKFKKEFMDSNLPNALKEARKKAEEAAFAEAVDKAIADAEPKVLEAKAKELKKVLTDDEIDKTKEALAERIKKDLEKDHAKIVALAQDPELEKNVKAGIEQKFANITGVKCVSCHTDYGRQARFKFDDWGTLVRPNNFTQGVFRGGKRPVDMYYRIHSGIPGSGMVNHADIFKGHERHMWDLVNFLTVASFPAMHKSLDLHMER